MKEQRFYELLAKYHEGSLTPEEQAELLKRYRHIGMKDTIYPDEQEVVKERMFSRLNMHISPQKKKLAFFRNWRNVAAIITLAIGSLVCYKYLAPANRNKLAGNIQKPTKIIPGTNTATLTLGNGKKILLNSAANGRLAVQGNTLIKKNSFGQILYETITDTASAPVQMNTITTPNGGQFQVILPDKTVVWLDAASSLTYPSAFRGNERHVILTGEAYFEVAKNKHKPFVVTADKNNIKVLGTHFNIMAYQNEDKIETTLLEGSVALSAYGATKMLIPGQRGSTDRTGSKITVMKVNVNDAISWKNGYFSFRDENIQQVLNKVARWYNVDIQYEGSPSKELMGGGISRYSDFSVLLNYLQLTKIAKFKIEGRRVMVISN